MTSGSPVFSVIVPCFNVARSLPPTLESLAAQTFTDFETIAVNDGSTDDTRDVLTAFKPDHPFRIIEQENHGLGGARNAAISAARGTYLAFLDADDLWQPEKLARVHQCLEKTNADLVCHDEYFAQDSKILRTHRYGPHTTYLDLLFLGNCLSPSAVTVRRDLVEQAGPFSEDRRSHGIEDYDMWLRLAEAGACIHYLHEPLGIFVMHGDNMSSKGGFAARESFVLGYHLDRLDSADPVLAQGIRRRWGLHFACVAWEQLQLGDWRRAARNFGCSLARHPLGAKVWKYLLLGPGYLVWRRFRRFFSAGQPRRTEQGLQGTQQ